MSCRASARLEVGDRPRKEPRGRCWPWHGGKLREVPTASLMKSPWHRKDEEVTRRCTLGSLGPFHLCGLRLEIVSDAPRANAPENFCALTLAGQCIGVVAMHGWFMIIDRIFSCVMLVVFGGEHVQPLHNPVTRFLFDVALVACLARSNHPSQPKLRGRQEGFYPYYLAAAID